jgi:hypothetical protein
MVTLRQPNRAFREKSAAFRLLVGIPVLCAAMALCAWVAWAHFGFPSDLSPRHWWSLGIVPLLGMVFCGGLAIALGAGALWIFGIVAGAFGEVVITTWQRLRRVSAPDARRP